MRPLERGYTLIEMLVALVLLGIVSFGIYRVLVGNQRIYHAQVQRVELQQNIRAAADLLPAEIRELDANDGDLYAMSTTSLDIRAMRQLGFLCSAPVLPVGAVGTFMVRRDLFFGARNFDVARDSLLLYYEGDEATRNDDGWVLARPTLITNGVCPGDGRAAWQITATLVFGPGQVNGGGTQRIQNGSPVRGFVPVRYQHYLSATDGRWYVGYDELTDAAAVQPLIGPLTANGLTFAYYDSAGAVTANRALVQMIEVRLRAETAEPVHRAGAGGGGGGLYTPVDSVVTRVALRNNRRW
ncbi:MAG: PilW family protein [Gemmatimonadales bacterium]